LSDNSPGSSRTWDLSSLIPLSRCFKSCRSVVASFLEVLLLEIYTRYLHPIVQWRTFSIVFLADFLTLIFKLLMISQDAIILCPAVSARTLLSAQSRKWVDAFDIKHVADGMLFLFGHYFADIYCIYFNWWILVIFIIWTVSYRNIKYEANKVREWLNSMRNV